MAILLSVYYGLDWMPLRVAQRDAIGWSLRASGYEPWSFVHEGSPAIRAGHEVYFYTEECTYLDLVMIVSPFIWVFGASLRRNILRVSITALVILTGNVVRCWVAVYLGARGIHRFYAHDLPDYIIWWPTVVAVVLFALRRDFGDRRDSPTNTHPADRAVSAVPIMPVGDAKFRLTPAVEDG